LINQNQRLISHDVHVESNMNLITKSMYYSNQRV
jgi:hypothetical protein